MSTADPTPARESVAEFRESGPEIRESGPEIRELVPEFRESGRQFRESVAEFRESGRQFRESVPAIRESVPEIRESVPEIRESVPEIRESGRQFREVRRAVRGALAERPDGPLVVAVSGGADSLALAAAAAAVRPGRVCAAVVDHGLQDGAAERARATVDVLDGLGIPADVHPVTVSGPGGTEAAARTARYAALRAARPAPDAPVLLGHTLDDQAETVLLGLGRGSGPRSLAGMRTWDEPWLRPLLGLRRATTRAACTELGLPVWDDPHNVDPRFTRVRLRHEVLPLLEEVLAGGVAEALARTATQLREDADALDAAAEPVLAAATLGADLDLAALRDVPPALRRRVLRRWLATRGVRGLTDGHLRAADDLAGRGPDRAGVTVPGGLELVRSRGRLGVRPAHWTDRRPQP